jgi:hypothetical protein
MLPHVTSLRAGHNIDALAGLVDALTKPDDGGEKRRLMQDLSNPQEAGRRVGNMIL